MDLLRIYKRTTPKGRAKWIAKRRYFAFSRNPSTGEAFNARLYLEGRNNERYELAFTLEGAKALHDDLGRFLKDATK